MFLLSIPVNVYQVQVRGVEPIFLLTLFKGAFTVALTVAVVSVSYYGTLSQMPISEMKKVFQVSLGPKGAMLESALATSAFMAMISFAKAFWTHDIYTVVSLVAAYLSINLSVKKLTRVSVFEDLVVKRDLQKYSMFSNSKVNDTIWVRRVFKWLRSDSCERASLTWMWSGMFILTTASIVQIFLRYIEASQTVGDLVNLLAYYPALIAWSILYAVAKRRSSEKKLARMKIRFNERGGEG